MRSASKLFFGGRIYTMSEHLPVGDAMLVDGDRVSWVGSISELSAVPTDSYDMVDLDGCTILPGLIDSHIHLFNWAKSLQRVNLSGAKSLDEVLRRVKKSASDSPKGWIEGRGWKKDEWRKARWPDRSDLDRIIPNRPVALLSKDEHVLWVNSRALEIAKIGSTTSDPDGGIIDRGQKGEPTGILRESAAWMVQGMIKQPGKSQSKRILENGFAEMFRQGCVGVGNFDTIDGFSRLQEFDVECKLPVRVVQYLPVTFLDEAIKLGLKSGFGSEHLSIGGIKIFADGALGSQTALMLRPYSGSGNNRGVETLSPGELKRFIGDCSRAQLSCAVHAIGDQANRNVLDAIQSSSRAGGKRLKHRIEHCQIVSPKDVSRFRKLGVTASMQPSHAVGDIDLMKRYLGRRRYHSYRFRTFDKLGVRLAFGSDAPIQPLNPLAGIHAAVVGRAPGGKECFNRSQLLSIYRAVRAFTLSGAEAVGQQRWRGSLEPGKKADFVILDQDLFRIEPEKILGSRIVATYIDGKQRYLKGEFAG
jgi:predicted amidohydrolase YtcJ